VLSDKICGLYRLPKQSGTATNENTVFYVYSPPPQSLQTKRLPLEITGGQICRSISRGIIALNGFIYAALPERHGHSRRFGGQPFSPRFSPKVAPAALPLAAQFAIRNRPLQSFNNQTKTYACQPLQKRTPSADG
jgi:hypothetical protein